MKREIKESSNFGMFLEVVWALTVLLGTGYVVFVLHRSGWWWLLGLTLMSASLYKKKTIEDNDE